MTPLNLSRPSPAWTVRARELVARIAARVRALTSTRRAASAGLSIADQMIGPLVRQNYEIRPRIHGRLKDCLRIAVDDDTVHVGVETGLLRRSGFTATNALTGTLNAWIPEPEEAEAEVVEWPETWQGPQGYLELAERRLGRCVAVSIRDAIHCGLTVEQTADTLWLLFAGRFDHDECERRIRRALTRLIEPPPAPGPKEGVNSRSGPHTEPTGPLREAAQSERGALDRALERQRRIERRRR